MQGIITVGKEDNGTVVLGKVSSEGSYLNRSYITDITIIFIPEKEFFIFIVFYPPKTQFLFLLNFEFSLQNEAGSVSVFLWCLPETYSHIKERSASNS